MREKLRKFITNTKIRLGWNYCPGCAKLVRLRFTQDPLVFDDEPPMFYHYQCPKCGYKTERSTTMLLENVVKSMGYRDFTHFAQENILDKDDGNK